MNVQSIEPTDFLKLLAHDLRWRLITALTASDYRVQELVEIVRQPQNLVSYHLKQLRSQHLVSERHSSADARDIYCSLDLVRLEMWYHTLGAALHPSLVCAEPVANAAPSEAHPSPRILFLCTENSARSQMAEGILRHLNGNEVEVFSAGTAPSSVHPYAIRAMAEIGIDISQQRAKHTNEFRDQPFDYVITVCDRAREKCPTFAGGAQRIHWSLPDPLAVQGDEAQAEAIRQTVQELMIRVRYLSRLIDRNRAYAQNNVKS